MRLKWSTLIALTMRNNERAQNSFILLERLKIVNDLESNDSKKHVEDLQEAKKFRDISKECHIENITQIIVT